jgi:hypothetical protein
LKRERDFSRPIFALTPWRSYSDLDRLQSSASPVTSLLLTMKWWRHCLTVGEAVSRLDLSKLHLLAESTALGTRPIAKHPRPDRTRRGSTPSACGIDGSPIADCYPQ